MSDDLLDEPGSLGDKIKVTYNGKLPRPRRKMFIQLPFGAIPGMAPICCDSSDPATQIAGITKRVGRKCPTIDPDVLLAFAEFVHDWLESNLTPIDTVLTFQQWLEDAPYPQTRKRELQTVFERTLGVPTAQEASHVNSFQKTESYEEFKLPRGINSRSDAFKVYSGPFFKSIENEIYKLPEFIKHVPVAERPDRIAQYLKRAGAQYFATDYSAFEASFGCDLLQSCECQMYEYMLRKYPEHSRAITRTIIARGKFANTCHYRCGVTVTAEGRRMSGDMCTSLGNGFTNLMIFKFLMKGRNARILVEGDDGLAAVYDSDPLPTEVDYAALGMTIKISIVDDPMLASFCGVICPGGVTVRDPHAVLASFGWSKSCVMAGTNVQMALLRAKALSLAYELPRCPLLTAVARRTLVLTRGYDARFEALDAWKSATVPRDETSLKFGPIPMEARLYFQTQFGIPVERQIQLEEAILHADQMPSDIFAGSDTTCEKMRLYALNFVRVG